MTPGTRCTIRCKSAFLKGWLTCPINSRFPPFTRTLMLSQMVYRGYMRISCAALAAMSESVSGPEPVVAAPATPARASIAVTPNNFKKLRFITSSYFYIRRREGRGL